MKHVPALSRVPWGARSRACKGVQENHGSHWRTHFPSNCVLGLFKRIGFFICHGEMAMYQLVSLENVLDCQPKELRRTRSTRHSARATKLRENDQKCILEASGFNLHALYLQLKQNNPELEQEFRQGFQGNLFWQPPCQWW